jgi:hypothetical protein
MLTKVISLHLREHLPSMPTNFPLKLGKNMHMINKPFIQEITLIFCCLQPLLIPVNIVVYGTNKENRG